MTGRIIRKHYNRIFINSKTIYQLKWTEWTMILTQDLRKTVVKAHEDQE